MEHSADVIIYGGTSSAVIAAVRIAQSGQSVILVCPDEHLGGLSASGLGWTDTGNKEVIGGLARDFYHRVYLHYQKDEAWVWQTKEEYGNKGQDNEAIDPEKHTMWIFEPHVAEMIFNELITQNGVTIFQNEWLDRVNGVQKEGNKIQSIKMLSGTVFKGKIFMDATYEGDLMATSGVSYLVGREHCDLYEETWNGIQTDVFHHDHHFKSDISPFVVPNDLESGLLPRVSAYAPQVRCHGDERIQAYCFRMCLSKLPENRVPITQPEGYDPWQYELLARVFESGWDEMFKKFDPIPNWKTDVNNHGPFSFDNIGMNYAYPEGSYALRKKIIVEHERYQKGLLYFVQTDPRVPKVIQEEMNEWGYAKDEFVDNNHWPHQIYVREARRMLGSFVMTEHQILGSKTVQQSIGMGSYMLDSHNVQRYVKCDGYVQNEGDIGVLPLEPYQIELGTILPQKEQCQNLLVTVALSSTHTAFGSMRMEPVFMVLGHSAATLAGMALMGQQSIHDISYPELRKKLIDEGQVLEYA